MTEKPSFKESQRYLKLRIRSQEKIEFKELLDSVWEALLDYMGEKGTSRANPWLIKNKFDFEEQQAILKITEGSEKDVRASLALQNSIDGKKAVIEVRRQSGTLKGLKK